MWLRVVLIGGVFIVLAGVVVGGVLYFARPDPGPRATTQTAARQEAIAPKPAPPDPVISRPKPAPPDPAISRPAPLPEPILRPPPRESVERRSDPEPPPPRIPVPVRKPVVSLPDPVPVVEKSVPLPRREPEPARAEPDVELARAEPFIEPIVPDPPRSEATPERYSKWTPAASDNRPADPAPRVEPRPEPAPRVEPRLEPAPRVEPRLEKADSAPTQVSRYTPDRPDQKEAPTPRVSTQQLLASINPILAKVPCAVLGASIEDNAVKLKGFVFDQDNIERIRTSLTNLRGVSEVRTDIRRMSDAQCRLVNMMSPFVAANRDFSRRLSVRAPDPNARYMENDNLIIDLGAPGRAGYIYVDYYSLDGGVVHLMPSPALPGNRMSANSSRRLGDRPANGEWMIGKPLGVEMIVVISSTEKLFSEDREEVEKASDYLPALRDGIERVPGKAGGAVVAEVMFITTVPRQ